MIVAHNSDLGLAFYNDRVKEIIAADLIAEPFTYVPIVAGHMELVGGNAIVFGKITEGYDVIALDVEKEITYQGIGSVAPQLALNVEALQINEIIANNPAGPCLEYRTIIAVLAITLPSKIYEGSTYFVDVLKNDEALDLSASYVALPGETMASLKAGLEAAMTSEGMQVVAGSPPNQIYMYERNNTYCNDPYELGTPAMVFDGFVAESYISSFGYSTKFPQLKCGAVHGFGIVYKDRSGRTCSVIKNSILEVYIPFYSENTDSLMETIINLVFKITHKPPEWAESYEIVYFGNLSMDYFLQLRAETITSLGRDRYSLNIVDNLYTTRNKNNRWKIADYSWLSGDRVRLMGSIDEDTAVVTKFDTIYYGGAIGGGFVYDYEIEATGTQYDEEAIGGDWLIFQAVDHPEPFVGTNNILVEIYRPRKGLAETVAYGTGMVFKIKEDAYGYRYHDGDIPQVFDVNGVCITPASVNNTANDCWKFIRLNYKNNASNIIYPFWAESILPSDWWGDQLIANKLTSRGFPFLDDLSQRQAVLDERIRHGGFLITGTRTNNIAHFTYDDFMDLAKKNGQITGMREVGFTLKIIQLYKETSIYINRIQTFNPDGTEQFTLTDKFLAEQRPMDDDYGSQHPDSIMVNGRYLYYWDNSQGVFIRSAPNGQTVLDIKMKRYFKDLIKWIQLTGGKEALQVRTGANNDHDEVWVTFRTGTETKGLIFSEKQGRYITRINQTTESYLHLGNFFAHLYQQKLWIMNIDEGQGYLRWNGVDTYAEIEVVSNVEPEKNKVYNAVALFADHQMDSLPKYVYIPREASAGGSLMESNISIWDHREGIFFGEILKDENSKGTFVSLNDKKMNGNALRGRFCFVKLYTDEHTEKVRIDSIVIFSTLSERNV